VLCVVVDYLLFVLLELCFPRSNIDVCRDWPKKKTVGNVTDEPDGNKNLSKRVRTSRVTSLETTKQTAI